MNVSAFWAVSGDVRAGLVVTEVCLVVKAATQEHMHRVRGDEKHTYIEDSPAWRDYED